jgi:DNA-binding protein Fis
MAGNVAVGNLAGGKITTGYGNVLIGEETGRAMTTGHDNVWIGKQLGNSGDPITVGWTIVLGDGAPLPAADDRVHIGDTFKNWIGGQVTWSTYSDARYKVNPAHNIPGLEFILRLKPVSYNWDIDALNRKLGITNTIRDDNHRKIEQIRMSGFLAQEVEEAARACGYDFSGIDKTNDVYSLSYAQFVVPLVKAVQEQQELIRQQQSAIETLQMEVAALREAVEQNGMRANLH